MVEFKEHSSGQLNDFFFIRNNIIREEKEREHLGIQDMDRWFPSSLSKI